MFNRAPQTTSLLTASFKKREDPLASMLEERFHSRELEQPFEPLRGQWLLLVQKREVGVCRAFSMSDLTVAQCAACAVNEEFDGECTLYPPAGFP